MSNSEKGHAKNLANANLINSYITQLGTTYQPSNPEIKLSNLQNIYSNAYEKQQDIHSALPPYTLAVNDREAIFEPLNKKITKLRKVYKVTQGVTPAHLEDFMTIARKIKGIRKTSVAAPVPPETAQTQHSVSQMSYDQRTNNFAQMIEFLQNTPNYGPNETEFQIATFQNQKDQMLLSTQRVADAYIPLNISRGARNTAMYTGESNLVDTFNKAKDYLRSILETNSNLYKAISKITFTKI